MSQRCLNDIGICFMFAPLYHTATARVAAIRREIGVPTTFNLLGPLTNPAQPPFQIVGVCCGELVKPLAKAMARLGTTKTWVVHGSDGLDEMTLSGPTFVTEADGDTVREFEVKPADFGLPQGSLGNLSIGNADTSARLIRDVLQGVRRDEARDIVVLNAAAALFVGGNAASLPEAARLAENSIDSGAAQRKLKDLVRMTNE
jgi:anthranilate phosphoribosyltransferase